MANEFTIAQEGFGISTGFDAILEADADAEENSAIRTAGEVAPATTDAIAPAPPEGSGPREISGKGHLTGGLFYCVHLLRA